MHHYISCLTNSYISDSCIPAYAPWLVCLCEWMGGWGLHWWDHRYLCVYNGEGGRGSGEEVEVNDNQNKCLTFFFFFGIN